jgi:hypothetical protein
MKRTATSRLSGLVLGGLLVAGPSIARADAPTSPEQAEQQVQQSKEEGGVGYKTGAVQRAESEASGWECPSAVAQAPSTMTAPEAQHYAQLADQYRLLGGVAYKTGIVQRAEADARRAQARADEAAAQGPATPATSPETYPGACNTDDPWMQSPDCWK